VSDYPALLRASDLIGQLADLNYMRKVSGLFAEFEETRMNEKLGYASSAALCVRRRGSAAYALQRRVGETAASDERGPKATGLGHEDDGGISDS
jgi:hypothetical protein